MLKNFNLFADIDTDNDFREFIAKPNGIVVLNVYSQWCGPCISFDTLLVGLKLGVYGSYIWLANCNSDTISDLARFNRTSLPHWLILRNGRSVNLFVGCESPEFLDTVLAEIRYERLHIPRRSYDIKELLPVEVETRELIAEVNIQIWLQKLKTPLRNLNHAIDLLVDLLHQMKIRVTILGPHVQMNVLKDLTMCAEKYQLSILDRRIVKLNRRDFYTINFACTNPISEFALEEYYDRYVCVCIWRLNADADSEKQIDYNMFHFIRDATLNKHSSLDKTKHMSPLVPNLRISHRINKFKYETEDKYQQLSKTYGASCDALFSVITGLARTDYNNRRLLEAIFHAHERQDPHIVQSNYNFDVYSVDLVDDRILFLSMKDQKNMLYGRALSVSQFSLHDLRQLQQQQSELFGDNGIDDDLEYLMVDLEESLEDESLNTIANGSDFDEDYILSTTIPGMWMPDNLRGNAAVIHYLFNYEDTETTNINVNHIENRIVMAFKAWKMDMSVHMTIERNLKNVTHTAFFSDLDPDIAHYKGETLGEYNKCVQTKEDCFVISLCYDDSSTALNFSNLEPLYVSHNVLQGSEDTKNYFNFHKRTPIDPDVIDQIETLQKLYYLWTDAIVRSHCNPETVQKRDFFRVPMYRYLIQKRIKHPIPYSKQWYIKSFRKYLTYQKALAYPMYSNRITVWDDASSDIQQPKKAQRVTAKTYPLKSVNSYKSFYGINETISLQSSLATIRHGLSESRYELNDDIKLRRISSHQMIANGPGQAESRSSSDPQNDQTEDDKLEVETEKSMSETKEADTQEEKELKAKSNSQLVKVLSSLSKTNMTKIVSFHNEIIYKSKHR